MRSPAGPASMCSIEARFLRKSAIRFRLMPLPSSTAIRDRSLPWRSHQTVERCSWRTRAARKKEISPAQLKCGISPTPRLKERLNSMVIAIGSARWPFRPMAECSFQEALGSISLFTSGISPGEQPKPAAVLAAFSHWWHVALAFSPDGKWLATVSGSDHGPVQLWDVSAGPNDVKQGPVLPGPAWGVSAMAFSHNGRFLVAALGSGHHHPNDGTLLVWKKNDAGYELISKVAGNAHEISSLAFSPEDDALVTGYAGGGLRMWDFSDGVLKEKTPLRDGGNPVKVVTFLPSGQLLSAGNDGNVVEWDAKVGKSRQWKFGESLTSLAAAPRQPYLAVGLGDGRAVILHLPGVAPSAGGVRDDRGDSLPRR